MCSFPRHNILLTGSAKHLSDPNKEFTFGDNELVKLVEESIRMFKRLLFSRGMRMLIYFSKGKLLGKLYFLPKICHFYLWYTHRKNIRILESSCNHWNLWYSVILLNSTILANPCKSCVYVHVSVWGFALRALLFPLRRGRTWNERGTWIQLDQAGFTDWMPFLLSNLIQEISLNPETLCTDT